jgi:hypothetical protein
MKAMPILINSVIHRGIGFILTVMHLSEAGAQALHSGSSTR